ncbi:hypothetical protein DMUE_2203 [Dictyocoela muelleri]|nr:hypothetical protein DMUE_2203 [Dictyocoela muelleri]
MNILTNIKQNNFLHVKEYKKELEETIRKLSICLNWSADNEKIKKRDAFYFGLEKRTKLEMTRLNIQDIDSMYDIIEATEESLVQQYNDQLSTKKQLEKSRRQNGENFKRTDNKFCSYHKTHTHNESH